MRALYLTTRPRPAPRLSSRRVAAANPSDVASPPSPASGPTAARARGSLGFVEREVVKSVGEAPRTGTGDDADVLSPA